MLRLVALLVCAATPWFNCVEPKRVLYVTHSAGYVHSSIPLSAATLQKLGQDSGQLAVTVTEDLSYLTAERLTAFDAVFFFTSGELALTSQQKLDLLNFVRRGGGFGGVHSATDTLYSWPEYGELIGARFDGHPWVQEVRIVAEDILFRGTRHLAPSFLLTDEIYRFRELSRDRVHVVLRLDPESVGLADGDYPLAWTSRYGDGRVFYTALGHFEETWTDTRFQKMLLESLLWITKQDPRVMTAEPAASAGEPRAQK